MFKWCWNTVHTIRWQKALSRLWLPRKVQYWRLCKRLVASRVLRRGTVKDKVISVEVLGNNQAWAHTHANSPTFASVEIPEKTVQGYTAKVSSLTPMTSSKALTGALIRLEAASPLIVWFLEVLNGIHLEIFEKATTEWWVCSGLWRTLIFT